MKSMDLHVRGIIRVRGGVIYRTAPAVTDIMGYVQLHIMPNGKRMYLLEPGQYVVQFVETIPGIEVNTYFNVDQPDLHRVAAHLDIATTPFEGVLQVFSNLQIEDGSKLGTLQYRTFPDSLMTLPTPELMQTLFGEGWEAKVYVNQVEKT